VDKTKTDTATAKPLPIQKQQSPNLIQKDPHSVPPHENEITPSSTQEALKSRPSPITERRSEPSEHLPAKQTLRNLNKKTLNPSQSTSLSGAKKTVQKFKKFGRKFF